MSEGPEPGSGHPEPEPEHPTGPQDPFDPLKPDDPYGITPAHDPLAPDHPDPDPTTTGGVEIPPPPTTPPGGQPPPGHAALTTAVTGFGPLPDPRDPLQAGRVKCWQIAQDGRYSLSDQWSMIKSIQLAGAEVAAGYAGDPDAEKAKLGQLRQDLGTDGGGISAALDAWCAARDATPADLAALADAAAKLKMVIDPVQKLLLPDPDKEKLAGVDMQRAALGEALNGIVAEVTSEGCQVLAGERVPRGRSSDVAVYHLAKPTRDQNWSSRLEASKTWKATGSMVRNGIGAGDLAAPVSKAVGKLDLQPLLGRLAALDAAAKAREMSGGSPDYTTRADVLLGYAGVADALGTLLKTVRKRQAELANPKAPAGWDLAQARNAGDVLAGLARALQAEFSADPLMQDPDLASRARADLGNIGGLAGQTSLEALVDKAGTDLRKVWRDAKTSELAALKAVKGDLGDLPKLFDAGLGPLLDQWSQQIAKFPKHDRATVKDLAAQIAEQLQRYRTAINKQLGDERSSGLVEGLDVVAAAMARQIRSFDSQGGLFG